MRETSFVGAFNTILGYTGHRQEDILELFERIIDLPEDLGSWEGVYSVSLDAQLEFYPWSIASDAEDLEPPSGVAKLGLPETLVHNAATLSSSDWFNCSADHWLRVVAADGLSETLQNCTMIKMFLDESNQKNKEEIARYLPGMVNAAIAEARILLTAADAWRGQSESIQSTRRQQARAAAKRKNYKFVELHNEFFEYFVRHQGEAKSRAQLAREFVDTLIDRYGSERNMPFLNRETAQRSLLDNLRKRLADDTTA